MGRILGAIVLLYLVVGFIALWATAPDTAEELCRTSHGSNTQRSLILWPMTLYLEHDQKPCLGS